MINTIPYQSNVSITSINHFFLIDVKFTVLNSNSYNGWEGRLEVIIDGKHGTVDGRHFTQNIADRFCKYLGYNER